MMERCKTRNRKVMTPQEKAKGLVDRFGSGYPIICKMDSRNMYRSEAKQCAIIAVDEILKANKVWYKDTIPYKYWSDVKHEIEKL